MHCYTKGPLRITTEIKDKNYMYRFKGSQHEPSPTIDLLGADHPYLSTLQHSHKTSPADLLGASATHHQSSVRHMPRTFAVDLPRAPTTPSYPLADQTTSSPETLADFWGSAKHPCPFDCPTSAMQSALTGRSPSVRSHNHGADTVSSGVPTVHN